LDADLGFPRLCHGCSEAAASRVLEGAGVILCLRKARLPMLARLPGEASAGDFIRLERLSGLPAARAIGRVQLSLIAMRFLVATTAAAVLLTLSAPADVQSVNLDQACQKFSSKLTEAQASGDRQKVQNVYTQGSQRIAKKFNGATCSIVKPVAS
jgi:hypothetical protein